MPPNPTPDSYPGTPGTTIYAGRAAAPPPPPPGTAFTAFAVTNDSGSAQATSPVTLGHSFKAGDWDFDTYDLYAKIAGTETAVSIQHDAESLHTDGSVRYAVLSLDAGSMTAGQAKNIELFVGPKRSAYNTTLSVPSVNLVAEATIYGVQQTRIVVGVHGGPKFTIGEVVTLRLTLGGTQYDYSITIDAAMAENSSTGGSLYLVANAFAAQVNAGTAFIAQRVGEGGGYEKFWIEPAATDAGAFTVEVIYAGAVSITHSNLTTYAPPVVWTASLQETLAAQIASSNAGTLPQVQRRLHGPVVSEFRQAVKFKDSSNNEHPYLTAFFDTRIYGGSRAWVDVILENTGLTTADPQHVNYKLDIKIDGSVVHSQPRFWHYSRARWHKQVWKGGDPKIRVTKNLDYWLNSRAVPNYRKDLGPTSATLDSYVADVAAERASRPFYGPMNNVLMTAYMPTTGGRGEIAPLPKWMVDFIITQDSRALDVMLAAADSTAGVGNHYRDEATGWPAGLDTRPSLSFGTFSTFPKTDQPNLWTPDTAHQGSFGYVPYLTTGNAFYLDEMMFWASYNLAVGDPGYRVTTGVGNLLDNQIRGTAWGMRSLAEVVWSLPEWHPRKSYYRGQLTSNLNYFVGQIGVGRLASPLGAFLRPEGDVPPWQNDYLQCVLALMAENNEPGVSTLVTHIAQYTVGRVLADDEGFCAALAPGYYVSMREGGTTGAFFTTWDQYAQYNYPSQYGQACATLSVDGYPASATDYAANLRAMLGACANAGVADAPAAYAKWVLMTPAMDTAFLTNRQWAIAPR